MPRPATYLNHDPPVKHRMVLEEALPFADGPDSSERLRISATTDDLDWVLGEGHLVHLDVVATAGCHDLVSHPALGSA